MSGPSELPAPGADDVLYVIDLYNYVFRAYHALPPLANPSGEPTNATYGTLSMLAKIIEEQRPAYLAVATDSPGRGFRKVIEASYKATRPAAPPDLVPQLARCREIVDAYNIPVFMQADYEADDVIAALTEKARAHGLRVVIASSDKDLMQLVGDGVVLWDAMRNQVYGPAEVEKKLGVPPAKVRDLLALVGDTSDNVQGIRGVGVKTAAKLLDEFGSLEALLARAGEVKRPKLRESIIEGEPLVRTAYALVGLRTDATLDFDLSTLRWTGGDVERLRDIFTQLHFTRFLELLGGLTPAAVARSGRAPERPDPTFVTLLTREALERLVRRARETGQLAVVAFGPEQDPMRTPLTGIALSAELGEACYLPIGHRYLQAPPQLALPVVVEVLGPVLADPAVGKLGHDLKLTGVMLHRHGLPVRGARFDTMLASYLLNPETTNKLGMLAERDAGMKWTSFEALGPSRVKRKEPKPTIETIEVERATPFTASHAESVLRLAEHYRPQLDDAALGALHDELEIPLQDVLTQMELTGVLIEPAPLHALGEELTIELAALEQQAHEAAGQAFNVASPRQLETILFDELKLHSSRKTKTGRSTDADVLEALVDDHPLPKIVLEHRALAKLKGTYVDALPRLVHPETGRVHSHWEQAVAATGRLSSKDPNLQNIPIRTAHGKRIREAFVAPPGMVILSADYSQIELRVLAHLSEDPVLVEAFNTGQDVHRRTAMEVFGVPEAEVTPTMRSQCKTVNFGVIYGMGALALARELSIPRAEAKSFIDAYFERYQGVRTYMDATLREAKKSLTVHTLLGRRRILDDLHSANRVKRAYAERIAQNTPIQGTAADLLKLAMVKLAEPVVAGARMVLTVHDELVFEVPADRVEEAAGATRRIMETIHPLRVPLLVEVGWGAHWGLAH